MPHNVAALGNALARQHEVHFFGGTVQTRGLTNVRVHRVPSFPLGVSLFHASFLASLPFWYLWQQLVRGQHFDIVHGAGYNSPFANVVTAHTLQAREQRLQRNGARCLARKTWRQFVGGWDYRLYDEFSSFMEGRCYRLPLSKVVIAISQNVKDDLIREFSIPDEGIVIIPNGVDTDRFHPHNQPLYRHQVRHYLGLDEEDIVALFVGNYWERKGLRSCIQTVRSYPEPRLKLLVVGEGDPGAFATPQEMLDPHRKVVFVNRREPCIDEPCIEQYYAAADFLLFPSLYEPFGLVVLEAMASGLPAVVSGEAGVADLIRDGIDGLLLDDPRDAREIATKLEVLLRNSELRRRLGEEARRTALHDTWEYVAERTAEVYSYIAERKRYHVI